MGGRVGGQGGVSQTGGAPGEGAPGGREAPPAPAPLIRACPPLRPVRQICRRPVACSDLLRLIYGCPWYRFSFYQLLCLWLPDKPLCAALKTSLPHPFSPSTLRTPPPLSPHRPHHIPP